MPAPQPPTSFDPYQLITAVTELLAARGVPAAVQPGRAGDALAGAGMLLRALGIDPMLDSVDSLQRSTSKVWSDQE